MSSIDYTSTREAARAFTPKLSAFDNHSCWVTRFHRIFFGGAYLEVDGERFDANGIRQLYESDTYPLGRRA
jgi:hypothetical protein